MKSCCLFHLEGPSNPVVLKRTREKAALECAVAPRPCAREKCALPTNDLGCNLYKVLTAKPRKPQLGLPLGPQQNSFISLPPGHTPLEIEASAAPSVLNEEEDREAGLLNM